MNIKGLHSKKSFSYFKKKKIFQELFSWNKNFLLERIARNIF
jgi:hypothetical protein